MKIHRGFALILFSLAFAACAPGPNPTSGPKVSGIPAPANTPIISPAGPKLLIRLDAGDDDYGFVGQHVASYLDDGTVTRLTKTAACAPGRPCGALESNTLTASGLTALRALLTKNADLLAKATIMKPQIAPSKTSNGRNDSLDRFILEQPDGTRYAVVVPSAGSANASVWVADPARERLNALAAVLIDPATLGGGSLANATWAPYNPTKVAVFIKFTEIEPKVTPQPSTSSDGTMNIPFGPPEIPDLSTIGWPFAGSPDAFGSDFTPATSRKVIDGATYRCSFVPSADALAAIASLPKSLGSELAAGQLAAGEVWRSATLRWSTKSPTAGLSLLAVALLPGDDAGSCANALSY